LSVAPEITVKVKFIIAKLKDFYIHKLKAPKQKTRTGRVKEVKKRYKFGLHEVLKMVEMGEAKLVIIARNIMKVEEKVRACSLIN
jgi:ribosomal protein L7Ae-like RNA K-turn-binding protein